MGGGGLIVFLYGLCFVLVVGTIGIAGILYGVGRRKERLARERRRRS